MSEIWMLKYEKLKSNLRELGSVAVAFSGGVDSAFLLKTAHEVLGEHAVAVTAVSSFFPKREKDEAAFFCEAEGIQQFVVEIDELSIPGVAENPVNRCYLCKHHLFSQILGLAGEKGIAYVAEGSNVDDLGDYRPGLQAITELQVKSPLREAGFTKDEIRKLSRMLGLSTWKKPSYACLASRFVYGEHLTKEKLSMVEQAEDLLIQMGFSQMRVRVHGMMARIEVLPEDLPRIMEEPIRERIVKELTGYGFTYVTVDLKGFRSGSMNEILKTSEA